MVGWTPSTKYVNVNISKNAPALAAKPPFCPYCSDGVIRYSTKRKKFICDLCKRDTRITDELGNQIEIKD